MIGSAAKDAADVVVICCSTRQHRRGCDGGFVIAFFAELIRQSFGRGCVRYFADCDGPFRRRRRQSRYARQ